MWKRSLLLGLLLAVLILPLLTMTCEAQEGNSEADIYAEFQASMLAWQNARQEVKNGSLVSTRGAIEYYDKIVIPYNIVTGTWITGLNIMCPKDDVLTIGYFHDGEVYHLIEIDISAFTDVTFLVNDTKLLDGKAFQSPSTITVFTKNGPVAISQFLMNGVNGFGFQTFFSAYF